MAFSFFKRKTPADPTPRPEGRRPGDDKVTDPLRIADLLLRLLENRSFLTVKLPGDGNAYGSAVLKIDRESGYMLLDGLTPCDGHTRLLTAGRLSARGRLKGVTIAFEAAVVEFGGEDGLPWYRAPLPASLDYLQRRSHFRAHVPVDQLIKVHLQTEGGELLNAELRDLSAAGLSLRLNRPPKPNLQRGEVVPQCSLHLGAGRILRTRLQICHTDSADGSAVTRLGGRFLELDKVEKRELERLVAALERLSLRRQLK